MTDREILEMAAKAASINGMVSEVGHLHWIKLDQDGNIEGFWNPLTDDCDTFHLMSKLRLDVSYTGNWVFVSNDSGDLASEQCNDDPSGATRRAVVKAAAEIGKSVK